MIKTMFWSYLLHFWADFDVLGLDRKPVSVPVTNPKELPDHEPRNGLLMCPNDHLLFDDLWFFICYQPTVSFSVFAFVLLLINEN
jgi:hypothetical protein